MNENEKPKPDPDATRELPAVPASPVLTVGSGKLVEEDEPTRPNRKVPADDSPTADE